MKMKKILEFLRANKLEANPKLNLGQLQGELFDEFVEAKLINPTFITEYPVEMNPILIRSKHQTGTMELFL